MSAGRWAWLLGVLLLGATPAAQQPPRDGAAAPAAIGTASLTGTVVNDLTNQPVRRAIVTLSAIDRALRPTAVTDDAGVFTFNGLASGRYSIAAARPGYVSVTFGATRPGRPGTPVAIVDGQRRTGVTLRLPPGGVVTGTIRNRSGEPLPGMRVALLRSSFGSDTGERTLVPAGAGSGLGTLTDDRGVYRIFGLPADEYYVVVSAGFGTRNSSALRETTASEVEWATRQMTGRGALAPLGPVAAPPAGQAVDLAPMFHPGSLTQSGAAKVAVKAGEERSGIDVAFDLIPTATIRGTVTGPDGPLPPSLQVNIVAHETIPGIPFSGFGSARVDRTGKFESAGLTPGEYTITVRAANTPGRGGPPAPAASPLFGMATVNVNGVDLDATVPLRTGVTVSGRVAFDGNTTPAPDPTRLRLNLTTAGSRTPSLGVSAATPDASGVFSFTGVTPGRYRITGANVGAWSLRSALIKGVDVLDLPIGIDDADIDGVDVRLTDRPSEIAGTLLDAAGQPAPEYFIIVFSTDKTLWLPQSRRIRSTRPSSDGRYRVQNLPPGEYLLAAVTDVEQGEWFDPTYLAALVGASIKLAVVEGETRVQDIKLAVVR